MPMTPLEFDTIKKLAESVDKLASRVQDLEKAVNMGRGGLKAILVLFGLLGSVFGIFKFFGR